MPPARSASVRNRTPAPARARAPVGATMRQAAERVRWDRVGRVALLVTLGIVVCLYIQPALSIFNTWRAERQQANVVHQLLSSNAALERQVKSLNRTSTIITDARALGMVRSGEKPYVVLGMPR
jgi:cell division protein FtsB